MSRFWLENHTADTQAIKALDDDGLRIEHEAAMNGDHGPPGVVFAMRREMRERGLLPRCVVYAIDRLLLTGTAPDEGRKLPWDKHLEWRARLPCLPALTLEEMEHLVLHRIVPHSTYSMQQSDFARQGFPVTRSPWKVMLPPFTLVIGLHCRDRYNIFADSEGFEMVTYESLDDWRRERDHAREAWGRV